MHESWPAWGRQRERRHDVGGGALRESRMRVSGMRRTDLVRRCPFRPPALSHRLPAPQAVGGQLERRAPGGDRAPSSPPCLRGPRSRSPPCHLADGVGLGQAPSAAPAAVVEGQHPECSRPGRAMTRSTSAPAPVLSRYSSGIAAAGGGTAYLRSSRPVPTYSLVSSRVNLACASITVEIHSTSLGLATCSW